MEGKPHCLPFDLRPGSTWSRAKRKNYSSRNSTRPRPCLKNIGLVINNANWFRSPDRSGRRPCPFNSCTVDTRQFGRPRGSTTALHDSMTAYPCQRFYQLEGPAFVSAGWLFNHGRARFDESETIRPRSVPCPRHDKRMDGGYDAR